MIKTNRSKKVQVGVLIGILVLIWLAALVFYWSVDPIRQSNWRTLASVILSYLLLWGIVFLCSNVSKIEKVQRFLLTSVSVALTVGLLEFLVLLNIVDFRLVLGTPIEEPWKHPDNLLDPKLLHIHKPHDRLLYNGIEYRYDQYGLRNEVDLEASDIVVIGDSFIEGWKVSSTDLLTSHLAKQLGRTVANLGQSWYGPQQELELLRRYGLQLHPKVCIWAFYEGNDLSDVHRYNRATRDWENFSKRLHSFRQRSFTRNAVLAVSRIFDLLRNYDVDYDTKLAEISAVFEESDGRKARIYFVGERTSLSASDYEALEELRLILGQAYKLCHANGAKFLFVFIPIKFRIYSGFVKFHANAQPLNRVNNDLPKMLEAIVREEIPSGKFLVLTPAFIEEARHGSLVYFPGYDTHWSPEGHRVAADAIANFLKKWK